MEAEGGCCVTQVGDLIPNDGTEPPPDVRVLDVGEELYLRRLQNGRWSYTDGHSPLSESLAWEWSSRAGEIVKGTHATVTHFVVVAVT